MDIDTIVQVALNAENIKHLYSQVAGMVDFHMKVLYIGLGLVITGVWAILRKGDDNK